MTNGNEGENGKARANWQSVVAYGVAIIALLGFALLIIDLLGRTGASDLEWTRAVFLLSGVEAVAFAGAGFLFGREVNRQRAESAEERGDAAEARASEAEVNAAQSEQKGRGLKAAVRAKAKGEADEERRFEAFGGQERAAVAQAGCLNSLTTATNRPASSLAPYSPLTTRSTRTNWMSSHSGSQQVIGRSWSFSTNLCFGRRAFSCGNVTTIRLILCPSIRCSNRSDSPHLKSSQDYRLGAYVAPTLCVLGSIWPSREAADNH